MTNKIKNMFKMLMNVGYNDEISIRTATHISHGFRTYNREYGRVTSMTITFKEIESNK